MVHVYQNWIFCRKANKNSFNVYIFAKKWGLGVSQPPSPRLRRLYISIWLEIGHDLPLLHMTISNKAKLLAHLGC